MKTKEERNAYMREYMRRKRANQTDEEREKNKEYMRQYRKNEAELAKTDIQAKERIEHRLEISRNYSRKKISKLKQDPEAWEEYLKKQSKNSSTYFQRLTARAAAGDPDAIEKLEKRRAYLREHNREKYAEKKAKNNSDKKQS